VRVTQVEVEKVFNDDTEYVKVQEDNRALKEKIANLEESIARANFNITQLVESLKMAELEREKEIHERKEMTEEYDEKQRMLSEIVELNKVRQEREVVNTKNGSLEIAKAADQTLRLQKSLEETKKKLLTNEQIDCGLSNDVWKFGRDIQTLKDKKKTVIDALAQLKSANDAADSQLAQLKSQMGVLEETYEKTLKAETSTSLDLFELERELQYLRGRKERLNANLELKEVIGKLNIEDLHKVVQKNNDLNSTVASLMSKWDDIKNFSRI
jgi:chromosome segregation ATPase